ncbi:MAG: c-type cytochrome [Gammaproteobacteria bacterium]
MKHGAVFLVSAGIGVLMYLAFAASKAHEQAAQNERFERGQALYGYYCYQCHGYGGDARTLASSYLAPRPRDFTAAAPDVLTRAQMVDAVSHGRPATAMMAFGSTLVARDIEAVVDYVRARFMTPTPAAAYYHTAANGWVDHGAFALAFPFVSGTVSLATASERLTSGEQAGKKLYLSSCIVCHDHGNAAGAGSTAVWQAEESEADEYYPHGDSDHALGAAEPDPHDTPAVLVDPTAQELHGQQLYLQNCAFCHAADGSGSNWIGHFLRPHPVDLRDFSLLQGDDTSLREVIQKGLTGTSMPAWKQILRQEQIDDISAYLKRVFLAKKGMRQERDSKQAKPAESLRWQRD